MTYLFNRNVFVGGEFGSDLFGRLKVAEPFTLFDSSHRYQSDGDFSDEITGTASATHLPNESSVALAVGSDSGDELTRESKRVFPYQPGKSLQVMQTFVMNYPEANLRQRVGYFSRQNGVYFEVDGTDVNIVKRTYITGSVVETRVAQDDWNRDTFDGTGPSGITLDVSKAQILATEYEWLGVGSVRVGFVIDGNFITAHQFNHANVIESVYMTTATLPVRLEITNTGETSGTSTLKHICTTVISNGGYTPSAAVESAIRNTDLSVGTTSLPVAAIRLKSGRTDAVILPNEVSVVTTDAGYYEWSIVKNPTLTGGTWVTSTNGNVEYNITATGVSGGTRIRGGFVSASNQAGSIATALGGPGNFELQLGRTNASSPVSDVYVLIVRTVTSTGSVIGNLSWQDLT